MHATHTDRKSVMNCPWPPGMGSGEAACACAQTTTASQTRMTISASPLMIARADSRVPPTAQPMRVVPVDEYFGGHEQTPGATAAAGVGPSVGKT